MKLVLKLGVIAFSAILLTACGNSANSEKSNVNSKEKQEQKVEKEQKDKLAKLQAEKKLKKDKLEKEKQDLLKKETQNVTNALKVAEKNPTWDNYNSAKKALEKMSKKDKALSEKLTTVANTITANEAAQKKSESVAKETTSEKQPTGETNEQGYSIDETTLTGFLNKYGMTPVAYKIQQGMSEDEALSSTPRDMKMSGEIQSEYMKYGR
ncbi:hypothetical protein [Brochothrix thermosphacta]|uniref:hypothetical protein n=1 Tax=Brochothrix thermosphacta TaxID=2756 RepID=UPI00083F5AAB|nr:hypothetical protein [Brochothrix thermosphacta]ODJ70245.1 hypothetical protein BFR43_08325 [Brochothrix thermosphacta]